MGSAYSSRSLDLSAQRAINVFPEVVETKEGKQPGVFFGTPGLDLLATVGTGPIRVCQTMGSLMYVVSGSTLYSVNGAYVSVSLGSLKTNTGPVQIVGNGSQILVVDGVDGYVWDTKTVLFTSGVLSSISVVPSSVAYQDGFAVVNNLGTTQWFQSNVFNFLVFNALNFSSADSQPDPVVTIFSNRREMFLFGTDSTEVWVNGGLPGFAFQRLQGVFLTQGCAAAFSTSLVGTAICWLGRDDQGAGVVYIQSGYNAVRISTHAIEHAIQGYSRIDDAIAYSYQQEGHLFYVLTFPTGNETWVYDLTSSTLAGVPMWHQRAAFANGSFSRHISNCGIFFNGKNVVGDFQNGNLYAFNLDTYQDNGVPIKRVRSWRAIKDDGNVPLRFNSLQIDLQTGIRIPDGTNPLVSLRWSDDGGFTFSNEKFTSLGKVGETTKRVKWNRLGQTRKNSGVDRIWEISHNENIPTAWIGADMDAEPA